MPAQNAIKYKELQDKNWLCQKYFVEKLSSKAIGRILNCNPSSVILALKRFDIEPRSSKDGRNLVPLQSFKYDLLNDKDWLYQKYVIEKISTEEIARLAGAKTANSARQALIRFGIELRN